MNDRATAKLRPVARQIVERISQESYDPKIRYIFLFGSEARRVS